MKKQLIKTTNGYMKIYIPLHPKADKDGYVYQHRIIIELKLGRYLTKEEIVHHKNGKRSDNSPSNLVYVKSRGSHNHLHSKRKDLQVPGSENPMIECACGCGKRLRKYDGEGRPRRYINGHNSRKREKSI